MIRGLIFIAALFANVALGASGRVIEAGTLKGTPTLTIENGGFSLGLPSLAGTILTNNSTATITNKTIDGASNSLTNVTASAFSGTLPVANGGTGLSSLGLGNYFLGVNSGATALEYKQFATGTSGTDFAIAHAAGLITFNLPTASATNRGALSSADWTTFNNKQAAGNYITDLTGDVTGSGPNSTATTISSGAVTNAKLANMTQATVKGRAAGVGTGAPVDLTQTQLTELINTFTSSLSGAVPASGGGTTNFLRADGTFATPPDTGITQLTGDVTAGPGNGSQAATLATVNANVGSFTNANITVDAKGRITAASSGSGGGGGDVSSSVGTSVDGEIALFDGTTGKLIKRATGTGYAKITSGVLSAQSTPIPLSDGGTNKSMTASAGAVAYSDADSLEFNTPGTSGQPLLSGGTGAPTFGTLGATAGGTGQTTYATGDIIYASASNTLSKLAAGTDGHVLTLAAGVPTWAASGGGSCAAEAHVAYFAATTNCSWPRASSSFGSFTTDTDCPGPTVEYDVGSGTTQTTDVNLPVVTVNSLPAGTYEVTVSTFVGPQNDGETLALTINDGTNSRGRVSGSFVLNYNSPVSVTSIFTYASSGNRSFELYGLNSQGNTVTILNSFGARATYFTIKRIAC